MGRQERPLNPDENPIQGFAFALRCLREAAGRPGYRELAERAHYSVTALAEAAGGSVLPSLPVALAYARACGGDTRIWAAHWRAAAAATATAAAGDMAAGDVAAAWRSGDRATAVSSDPARAARAAGTVGTIVGDDIEGAVAGAGVDGSARATRTTGLPLPPGRRSSACGPWTPALGNEWVRLVLTVVLSVAAVLDLLAVRGYLRHRVECTAGLAGRAGRAGRPGRRPRAS